MLKLNRTFANIFAIFVLIWLGLCSSAFGQEPANTDTEEINGFYKYVDYSHQLYQLNHGDNEFIALHLEHPISFYSDKYEHIFINTNGILTFNMEFPDYVNQLFPLEYASIAPFYSNVDTTGNNGTTAITIFESEDPNQLNEASSIVQYAFSEHRNFEANKIIVATWKNVGYFQAKTDQLNTFQAVIIVDEVNSFVQFIYPEHGLNWLQAETGPLGLPDIRPQAGFIAQDGRAFSLEGSATENVKYLAKFSNIGKTGNWLYQVGGLNNVSSPNNVNIPQHTPKELWTCVEANQGYCNSHAHCRDKSGGFCCICEKEYYGNGRSCIKNNVPIRVTGVLHGEINGEVISDRVKMQSYIVMSDARSYTAINPLAMSLGTNLRFALPIISTIGWLFAKPINGAINGYQLTGGVFTQVSHVHFESGEVLTVNQTFNGLNYWDQLSVEIEIFGTVPRIPFGSTLHMADYIDEYKFEAPGTIRSVQAHSIEVVDEKRVINFQLDQKIHFERCLLDGQADPTNTSVLQKVSKISLDYFERDQAVRSNLLNKIGVDTEYNACKDVADPCGPKAVCKAYDETFRCECLHGYGPQLNSAGEEVCLDIDECTIGTHVCDENAACSNSEGGFSCVCLEGFVGNGYRCLVNSTSDNIIPPEAIYIDVSKVENQPVSYPVSEPTNPQSHLNCYDCSHYADCISGNCICRPGFTGNGYECDSICPNGHIWLDDKCQPAVVDYLELEPQCDSNGECRCPDSYELSENHICTYVGQSNSDNHAEDIVSCNLEPNCHANATCEWYGQAFRYFCVCNSGFQGNGYHCVPVDESCALKLELCDAHASCNYNVDLGKSNCECNRGYEGDGFHCQLARECQEDNDCGTSARCDHDICVCQNGYERNVSDHCVPYGWCGSVYCGANALCKWDTVQEVQFCTCIEGYEGNALEGCRSIPQPCNVKYNCGVHADCMPTEDPAIYECKCKEDFKGDGYVCTEIENCLNNPHLCDMNAVCSSTNTGLVCVCNQGFYGNGSVCYERQRHGSGFLFVSQGVVIVRVPLNGKGVLPVSVASMAIGLDKDCVAGRVYWGDISAKKIESVNYDGSDRRLFISDDVESPEGIAIDISSRRIYWTDSVKDTIEVASLDDASLRAVIIDKNLVNPRGIAVDPLRQKLYWADWDRDSPKIEMSNLDGTERELLLGIDSVTLPNSLVVLENSGELCYADAGTKKIQCIEPYSKTLRTISNDLSYPFGLTFTKDEFYWTDWTTKKLEKIDSYGNNKQSIQIPLFGSHKMFGLTTVEDSCPQLENSCSVNNGGCTDNRICLSNRNSPSGKNCKCTNQSQNCNIPRYGVPV